MARALDAEFVVDVLDMGRGETMLIPAARRSPVPAEALSRGPGRAYRGGREGEGNASRIMVPHPL